MPVQQQLSIKLILDAWDNQIKNANKLLEGLSDEQLMNEVSPGRNRGIYLLGHLTAVHDTMFPLLGLSEKLYPQLEDVFIKSPDKSGHEMPPIKDLKEYWDNVNTQLSDYFKEITPDEWLQKHSAVSAEDFEKEPHRNRLNIIIGRTNHLAYHRGQLTFLNK